MTEYHWAAPEHPDPPENQPLGIPGVEWAEAINHDPVWVDVEMTRTGRQKIPGFVGSDRATACSCSSSTWDSRTRCGYLENE